MRRAWDGDLLACSEGGGGGGGTWKPGMGNGGKN